MMKSLNIYNDQMRSPTSNWWIKCKRFQLISFPELDIADVLVIPKRGGCSDMSPSDCQRAHRDYYGMPRSYVEQFCRTCPTCQKAAPNTTKAPLKPIVETEFLNRIQIDLIDMRHSPDNCYHYICHVMDHYSKFHIIYPLKTKTAHEVAISLEERVLADMGTPGVGVPV
ncbi:hypothetical protein LSAT2_007320 [Lamellibrachia satsuma]|nr:hypothetical protein LSAT2_007320 [Lamellibrachia satsuma]